MSVQLGKCVLINLPFPREWWGNAWSYRFARAAALGLHASRSSYAQSHTFVDGFIPAYQKAWAPLLTSALGSKFLSRGSEEQDLSQVLQKLTAKVEEFAEPP